MFIITTALKNLYRQRVRYIICGLFLLGTVSVLACALYYSTAMPVYMQEQKDLYMTHINLKFKKELQWNGNETFDYTVEGFNSDSSMDKYNKPIYVKKDFFEPFSGSEYVDRTVIAYTENVYGVFYDLEDNRQYRNLLYGGTPADIKITSPSHMQGELILTDGELNKQGECLIHRLSAKEYGYKIGDYITYTDIDGKALGKLKISGFFGLINRRISDNTDNFVFWVGSNPFFKNMVSIRRMIITDFDTVYYAYGNDENSSASQNSMSLINI